MPRQSANLRRWHPGAHVFSDAAGPGPAATPGRDPGGLEQAGDFVAYNKELRAMGYGMSVAGGDHPDTGKSQTVINGKIALSVTPAAGRPGRFLAIASRPGASELHRDTIDFNSATSRTRFVAAAMRAAYPGGGDAIDQDVRAALERRLLDIAAEPPKQTELPRETEPEAEDPRVAALAEMPDDVRADAEALLQDPNLLRRVSDDIRASGVVGEKKLALAIYLVGVSAQLPKPLAAIVRGPSSTGKSFLIERVSTLFPREVLVPATSLTQNALFYFQAGALRHRWIVAGERSRAEDDEQAEATRALREMIETGRLSKAVPTKEDERIVTRVIEQEGPIAYVETTTLRRIFEEDANRCLIFSTDERSDQTRRILAVTAAQAAGQGRPDLDRVWAVHHAVQRMLPRVDVIVSFGDAVAAMFPVARVESRRSFRHLMQIVKATALLHSDSNAGPSMGRVVASIVDYQIAAKLGAPAGVAHGGLSAGTRRFFLALAPQYPNEFSSNDARVLGGESRSTTHSRLDQLEAAGLVEKTSTHRGNQPTLWKLTGAHPESETGGLPTVDQVRAWLSQRTPGCSP